MRIKDCLQFPSSTSVNLIVLMEPKLPEVMSNREMHPATCADCKKETQVPFKPTEGRPVYCQECLPKHRNQRRF